MKRLKEEAVRLARWEATDCEEEFDEEAFLDNWVCPEFDIDESDIEGVYEGVHYQISHLGGAELLWVIESPHTGQFVLCSPCCPGACDGDSPITGGFTGYAVPTEWLRKE